MPEADLYRARIRYFYYPERGVPVLVMENSVARKGHEVIRQAPDNWEPLEVTFDVSPEPKGKAKAAAPEPSGKAAGD